MFGSEFVSVWVPLGSLAVAFGTLYFTYLRTKPDVRRANAEAATIELKLAQDLRDELVRLRKEQAALRDRVLQAEATAAKADAARAEAQANLAMALAKASAERHDLMEKVHTRDARIRILEEKVATLTARLDGRADRRSG